MRIAAFLPFFILLCASSHAQDGEYPFADGQTVNTCFGNFVDDGLEGPYSGNGGTFTICPDNPDDVIQIQFYGFSLSTSPNPNNNDVLHVFQGPDASFPYSGSYTGTDLSGITVTGNTSNTSGCLTFVLECPNGNGGGTPGWVGEITCTTPCDAPTQGSALLNPPPPVPGLDSVSVCIGGEVTFSGASSSAAPGFTLDQYVWNFDDGSPIDTLSGVEASHTFNEAGEYLVSLSVIDNNGCQSLNLTPLQVIVSTLPDVTIDYAEETCIGEVVDIAASVEGITWTSLPPQVVSGETYLADDLGFDFESTLTFDFFDPGSTLNECSDLEQIYINMEHSYLGDLEMIVECPDGTSVTLHEFGSGGGGTYLGETIDQDGPQFVGVGYDYGWSSESTLGFLYEGDNSSNLNWTDNNGNNWSGNVVNPGIYESQNDLCDLVGCPLNGTWSFIVTDNLGIDDGNIFYWGIDFNPELFPGVTTFTPIWGQGADSSMWVSGEFITATSEDANTITITPDTPGAYDYTFTTLNNYGCSFDTTININVLEPLNVNAGEDTQINCEEPYSLNAYLNATPFPSCDYTLNMQDNFANGWNGGQLEVIVDGVSTIYTMETGASQNITLTLDHGASIEIYYTPGEEGANQSPAHNQYLLRDGNNNVVFVDGEFGVTPVSGLAWSGTALCFPPEPDLQYLWSPADNLNNPNAQNPIINGLVETTTFTVEVWQPAHPDCVFTDEVVIEVSGALSAGSDIADCGMSYQLNGTDLPNVEWTAPADSGVEFADANSGVTVVTAEEPGTYTLTLTDLDGQACPTSSEIEVTFFDGIQITPAITEPICFGQCNGSVSISATGGNIAAGSDYIYTFRQGELGINPNELGNVCSGNYTIVLEDNDLCADSLTFFVNQPPAPIIDSVASVRESCLGACDGILTIYSPVAVTYSFDGGDTFGDDNADSLLCGGSHDVRIQDANGCEAQMDAFVASPTPPEAQFSADPLRASVFEPTISFANFSVNNELNDWIFGIEQQAGISQEIEPVFDFPSEPGIYTVQLMVTDSIGCVDSMRVDIEILEEFLVHIPNAFSPNNDGINDHFFIEITDLDPQDYQFQVFDRWGNVVFETNEYPTRWNGEGTIDKNYYVPDGVYIWRIKAGSLRTTKKFEQMGTLTVIR